MLNWRKIAISLSLALQTLLTHIFAIDREINKYKQYEIIQMSRSSKIDLGVTITHAITCQTTNSPIRA
jgi:hypothetical protein